MKQTSLRHIFKSNSLCLTLQVKGSCKFFILSYKSDVCAKFTFCTSVCAEIDNRCFKMTLQHLNNYESRIDTYLVNRPRNVYISNKRALGTGRTVSLFLMYVLQIVYVLVVLRIYRGVFIISG